MSIHCTHIRTAPSGAALAARALDPELAHPAAQRARIDAQDRGGAALPFDSPMEALEGRHDVTALHLLECSDGCPCGPAAAAATRGGRRGAERLAEAERGPGEVITARSTTLSSSRTLPGQS